MVLNSLGLVVTEHTGWHGRFTGDEFLWQDAYPGGRREEPTKPFGGTHVNAQRHGPLHIVGRLPMQLSGRSP
jgi:hypothetical protein